MQTLAYWARPLPNLLRLRRRYGPRFTVRLLVNVPVVMICDPDEIREVFTAPPDVLHPGQGAAVLEPIVGRNSVILLDENAHLEQRKLMLPAFHGDAIARMGQLMAEVAEQEVSRWPDGELALHERLQRLTLEIILRAVFGLDEGPRLDALRSGLSGLLDVGSNPVSMLGALQREFGGHGPWARFTRLREQTDADLHALIAERRAAGESRDDVLSLLLAARHEDGSPMRDDELRDELMTLLVAGHETTASALAWAFERLVRLPEVLGRVERAAREDDDAYLTATVQETLRRRPVLPNAAPRRIMQELEVGGWRYPTEACLAPCAYLVQHDPAIYPEPFAFRPERFLERPPGTYTWIPFGGGRRRCLGASFAMLEMKTVLRAVLTHAQLRPTATGAELTRRRSITISPGLGARVGLSVRRDHRRPAPVA